jgi:hypothetical protein
MTIQTDRTPPRPCIICGGKVDEPSMDGPYVCSRCDCGYEADGTPFTFAKSSYYYQRVGAWRLMMTEYYGEERVKQGYKDGFIDTKPGEKTVDQLTREWLLANPPRKVF